MSHSLSDPTLLRWRQSTQQIHTLLAQQEHLLADLLSQRDAVRRAANDFFVQDDYVRLVVEIKARERNGEQWPCRWHSMPMLADALTPVVGWLVSPNSLWRAFRQCHKYEDDIRRRTLSLRNTLKN